MFPWVVPSCMFREGICLFSGFLLLLLFVSERTCVRAVSFLWVGVYLIGVWVFKCGDLLAVCLFYKICLLTFFWLVM